MADFLPGDEEICFTCHLMQECTDANKLPPCLGIIEPVQQPTIDYTSVLEKELIDIAGSNLGIPSIILQSWAMRLNAVLQKQHCGQC